MDTLQWQRQRRNVGGLHDGPVTGQRSISGKIATHGYAKSSHVNAAILSLCIFAFGFIATPSVAQSTDTYEYDALGRLIEVDHSSDKTITYSYDSVGNRTAVSVAAANAPPVAVNDFASMDLFGTVVMFPLANDSDPDGDPLTMTSHTAPSALTTFWDAGLKKMTIVGFQIGLHVISYTISDGNGGSDTGTISVTVNETTGCEFIICAP